MRFLTRLPEMVRARTRQESTRTNLATPALDLYVKVATIYNPYFAVSSLVEHYFATAAKRKRRRPETPQLTEENEPLQGVPMTAHTG